MWKKPTGFLLFLKKHFLEKPSFFSTVTLGDFTVKNAKIGKGNLYLTENQFSRNEMCAVVNHNHNMCQVSAKGFLDLNFN